MFAVRSCVSGSIVSLAVAAFLASTTAHGQVYGFSRVAQPTTAATQPAADVESTPAPADPPSPSPTATTETPPVASTSPAPTSTSPAASVPPPDPAADSPERTDPEVSALKRLFDDAQVAFLAGRYTDAAAMFDEAYARSGLIAFQFNSAVAWERAGQVEQAVERYAQYIVASPDAEDHDEIVERLTALRQQLAGQKQTTVVKQVQTKGVAIITTKPAGAELRLDDPRGPVFATAPFRGTLTTGEHVIHVSAKGYKPESRAFPDNHGKVLIGHFALSEEYFLGHLEIKSSLAGADVYLTQLADLDGNDMPKTGDTDVPVGKTPFSNQLPPGKWHVRVEKPGYQPLSLEVEIPQGKVETLSVDPQLIPTAIVHFRAKTPASIGAVAYLDAREDKELCELPCEAHIPAGDHSIIIKKAGKKPLEFDVNARPADMVSVDVSLEPKTRRIPAIVTGVLMGGAGAVGTLFALRADATRKAIEADIEDFVQIDKKDPRAAEGRRDAIVADACFLGAAVLGSLTLYYLLRETGEPSQGEKQQRNLAERTTFGPVIGPGTIGVAGELRF